MNWEGQHVLSITPYAAIAVPIGVLAGYVVLRIVDYWTELRPWVIGIRAAKKKARR